MTFLYFYYRYGLDPFDDVLDRPEAPAVGEDYYMPDVPDYFEVDAQPQDMPTGPNLEAIPEEPLTAAKV